MSIHMAINRYVILIMLLTNVGVAAEINLAAQQKLQYAPAPNYHLTEHPRDALLLTDGVRDESLWSRQYRGKTVGWNAAALVEITVDLGKPCDVSCVNLYTVGGGRSEVEYPEYAVAMCSIDGNQYRFAGFADSDGWAFGGSRAAARTMVVPVGARLRYLKLYVRPTNQYFFTDEIEVIESKDDCSGMDAAFMTKEQAIDLVERARQLRRDSRALQKRISLSTSPELAEAWRFADDVVSRLYKDLSTQAVEKAESDIALLKARWLRSVYKTDWLCLAAEPMRILRQEDLPEKAEQNVTISLYQWRNESGSAAVNLVNCSTQTIYFKAAFSPLRLGDKTIKSTGVFELRRGLYVRVLNAGLVVDPLVLQNEKPFPVAPGQTVQLWLEAHSKQLAPGLYDAAVVIQADGSGLDKNETLVPIRLEVVDKTFPQKVPMIVRNSSYVTLRDRFTSRNAELASAAYDDLNAHYVNSHNWLALSPDNIKAELALAQSSGTRPFVLLFFGGKYPLERRFGTLRLPEWESKFCLFLAELRRVMFSSGYSYNDFALFPFDETVGEDFVAVAGIIRKFDPRLKIFANKWIQPDEIDTIKDLVDIWAPHLPDVLANTASYQKYVRMNVFEQVWCYQANMPCENFFGSENNRLSRLWRGRNETFWRTMPLVAVALQMQGAAFWAYQDADRTGWNKNHKGEYGVIYDGSENPDRNCYAELIVPSKRWQQWRQGVEDAVCLSGHRDLLENLMSRSNASLDSEYLTLLRKQADLR